MDPAQIIIEPIITEKSMTAKSGGRYLFRVHRDSTKIDIKNAVEKLFKVKVSDVNTVSVKGKTKMLGYKIGKTTKYKKAYVTVKKGQKIEELEV